MLEPLRLKVKHHGIEVSMQSFVEHVILINKVSVKCRAADAGRRDDGADSCPVYALPLIKTYRCI